MKVSFLVSYFLLALLAFGFQSDKREFKIIDYPQFESLTKEKSEKIRIFNFWATWCAPCVKEMPYFQKVQEEDTSLKLYFISMDDGRKPERVTSFMEKRNINSPVYLLNDVDYNKWIDKVDPSWSGAIPATLFIKPDGSKFFHEGEVDEKELKTMISQLK
ncbi:Thiol:disulfide interchange protein tlpA [Indibacter alkaliphilus LW1]|jgi:thiol-disulfide isomerase/thioredoxin|uniref:Thiol:disulfide interchange protein tlpA n=1 Tax=Indibacter alkaliphilus (strain CCUG 57479 / KCTC 22604 / LW1) TaxID=1189612 RepID=S2CZF4_INDAL|nr:TlpA disulfide reductase family protein [Indibacter alkaliphilus]EOZ91994.1 Thiol:disulfide interchange protein tlpA [Indibacter alkaliphilus LW1]